MYFSLQGFCPTAGHRQVRCQLWSTSRSMLMTLGGPSLEVGALLVICQLFVYSACKATRSQGNFRRHGAVKHEASLQSRWPYIRRVSMNFANLNSSHTLIPEFNTCSPERCNYILRLSILLSINKRNCLICRRCISTATLWMTFYQHRGEPAVKI